MNNKLISITGSFKNVWDKTQHPPHHPKLQTDVFDEIDSPISRIKNTNINDIVISKCSRKPSENTLTPS